MTNIDPIKKKTTDPTIGPQDTSPSYVDSAYNAASVSLDKISGSSNLLSTSSLDTILFQPGSSGGRVVPGTAGYAFADTPEATVFITKKQWAEGEWSYITTSKERSGKVQELITRLAIGNIITRKLDWLNGHEILTKFSSLTLAMNNADRGTSQTTKYYTEQFTLEPTKTTPKTTKDSREPFIYFASKIKVDPGSEIRELIYAEPRLSAKVLTGIRKDVEVDTTTTSASTTWQDKKSLPNIVNGLNSRNNNLDSLTPFPAIVDPDLKYTTEKSQIDTSKYAKDKVLTGAEFWEIDLTKLAGIHLYTSVDLLYSKNPSDPSKVVGNEIQIPPLPGAEKQDFNGGTMRAAMQAAVAAQLAENKVGYIARLSSDGSMQKHTIIEKATLDVTPRKKPAVVKPTSKTIENAFNGVIELTNVKSITTQISLDSDGGTAQITLVNPNNILTVSEDDIEIALGTNPLLDTPSLDELGNLPESYTTTDPTTNLSTTLRLYKGTYYTERAYQLITNQFLSPIGNFTANQKINTLQALTKMMSTDIQNLQNLLDGTARNVNETNVTNSDQSVGNGVELALKRTTTHYRELLGSIKPGWSNSEVLQIIPSTPRLVVITKGLGDEGKDSWADKAANFIPIWDGDKINKKIQTIQSFLPNITKQLTKESNLTTYLGPIDEEDKVKRARKLQLQRYFQNRTIFEILDRVYVWASSSSKTIWQLENGTLVSESLEGAASRYLHDVQQIISLITQLFEMVQSIALNMRRPVVFQTTSILQEINIELQSKGGPSSKEDTSSPWIKFKKNFEEVFTEDGYSAAPSTSILIQTIDERIKLLKQNNKRLREAQKPSSSSNSKEPEGLDLKALSNPYEDKLLPVDNQLQVFQGVITGITRNFSPTEGFSITLECRDNMYFLSRSRYIDVPNLNQTIFSERPFLDDPIWRSKDALLLNGSADDKALQDASSLTGRWKSGVFSLSANLIKEEEEATNAKAISQGSKTPIPGVGNPPLTIADINRSLGASVGGSSDDQIFNGAGPADIVSTLVTGVPFSVSTYVLNTLFPANSLKMEPQPKGATGLHSGEDLSIGNFAELRRSILQQKRKYGDFEPWLSLPGLDLEALAKDGSLKTGILKDLVDPKDFARSYYELSLSLARLLGALAAIPALVVGEEESIQKGFQRLLEALKQWGAKLDNLESSSKFIPKIKQLPTSGDTIELGTLLNSFNTKMRFFLYAAISQRVSYQQILTLFTTAYDANLFTQVTNRVPAASLFKDDKIRTSIGSMLSTLPSIESSFQDVADTVKNMIQQGALQNFFNDIKDQTPPNLANSDTSPAAVQQKQAEKTTLFRITSPLQSSRQAIIAKQKTNYLVIASDYLLTPNLVDYAQKMRAHPGVFADNEYKEVNIRCKVAADMIGYEFYADTQGNIRFKPPSYNRTYMRDLLNLSKVDSIYLQKMQNFLAKYKLQDVFKQLAYRTFATELITIRTQVISTLKSLIDQATNTVLPKAAQSSTGKTAGSSIAGAIFGAPPANTILAKMLENKDIDSQRVLDINALLNAPTNGPQLLKARNDLLNKAKEYSAITQGFEDSLKNIKTKTVVDFYKEKNIFDSLDKTNLTQNRPPAITDALNALGQISRTMELDLLFTTEEFKRRVLTYETTPITQPIAKLQARDKVRDYVDTLVAPYLIGIERCIALAKVCADELININNEINSLKTEKIDLKIQEYVNEDKIHNISSAIIMDEVYTVQSPKMTRLNATTSLPFQPTGSPQTNTSQYWVGAVDFDLWREHGYIAAQIDIPFINTGEEAVDYVRILMSREYSKTFRATITVRGDSKYQLGDCVFVEDENMYYYIQGINHNFTYGSNYSTTLTLGYGRRPGYYIPYPFDVLGSEFVDSGNANVKLPPSGGQAIINAQQNATPESK